MYGFGQAGSDWGGFLSDAVRVPYADHMLVPLPPGLDPAAVASASDNIADAWRTVGPPLERDPGAAVLIMGGAGAGLDRPVRGRDRGGAGRRSGSSTSTPTRAGARSRRASAPRRRTARASGPGRFSITVDASNDPEQLMLALRSTEPDGICTSTASTSATSRRCRCWRCI